MYSAQLGENFDPWRGMDRSAWLRLPVLALHRLQRASRLFAAHQQHSIGVLVTEVDLEEMPVCASPAAAVRLVPSLCQRQGPIPAGKPSARQGAPKCDVALARLNLPLPSPAALGSWVPRAKAAQWGHTTACPVCGAASTHSPSPSPLAWACTSKTWPPSSFSCKAWSTTWPGSNGSGAAAAESRRSQRPPCTRRMVYQ